MPDDFVLLAERTGLIHPLTRYVLDLVVRQVSEWDRQGREVPVAVNLSGRNLNEPRFVDDIADPPTGTACTRACSSWRSPRAR